MARSLWRPLLPAGLFRPLKAGLLMLMAALGGSGCATPHQSYESARNARPVQPGGAPLMVIEFDERGDYWDPGQYAAAEKALKSKSSPVLVTYVHGWRHDARPDDGDLLAFQQFLNGINDGLRGQVCGVFIGWRGASVQEKGAARVVSQPAALLSFWGRKKITDSMAGVPFTNTLWRLAAQTRSQGGHSVLIGHSFGGRIVERTLGPAAIAQMNNGKPMPYDLTFLINPATESLYARQLKLALRNWSNSQPAIVALAAQNDFATGRAWPWALLAPDFIRERDYLLDPATGSTESQQSYVTRTVGNDIRHFTHRLVIGSTLTETADTNLPARNLRHPGATQFAVRLGGPQRGTTALCRLDAVPPSTPAHDLPHQAYWVLPLPEAILSGHGGDRRDQGIFSPAMSDLMTGILSRVDALRGLSPVVPMANPAFTPRSEAPAQDPAPPPPQVPDSPPAG